jgi:hypothetical protein
MALLAGCASYSGRDLRPGTDGEARVRAAMGEPAETFREAGGESTWVYPHGPMGYDTFMARFTSAGTLASIENVLDGAHFARVVRGLRREEVRRILGPPAREEAFPRQGEHAWDYRFADAWGYASFFSVIFDGEGRVARTLTWRENMGGDHT